jgi:hypothetical protein
VLGSEGREMISGVRREVEQGLNCIRAEFLMLTRRERERGESGGSSDRHYF